MLAIDTTRYSLLELEGVGYLLPGHEVSHIGLRESIVRSADTSTGILGHLPLPQKELPLYAPNSRLRLQDFLPEERRFVACLNNGREEIALACGTIRPFPPSDEHLRQPLPIAQALRGSPLGGLMLDGERLYFLTDTTALIAYLTTQPIDMHEPESTSLAAER